VPTELRDRIRDRAAVERRSFSNECRLLIEVGLAVREQQIVRDLVELLDARPVEGDA